MSQAKTVNTTTGAVTRAVSSRRSLFGGAAAVVLGGGITAGVAASVADYAETPDAELIAMGAEVRACAAQYDRLLSKWWTLQCGHPDLEACANSMDIPNDRLTELAEQACKFQASTPEGRQVKAMLARHLMTVEHSAEGEMEFETFEQKVIWSLISDMTGGA